MFKWQLDFHMKNGEIISIPDYSEHSECLDLIREIELLSFRSPSIVYSTPDGNSATVIAFKRVSSIKATFLGEMSIAEYNDFLKAVDGRAMKKRVDVTKQFLDSCTTNERKRIIKKMRGYK